jgi:hypothetical protein
MTTISNVFSADQLGFQDQIDWEREKNRAFVFFELNWDTILELPFLDPNLNERCLREAREFAIAIGVELADWDLV